MSDPIERAYREGWRNGLALGLSDPDSIPQEEKDQLEADDWQQFCKRTGTQPTEDTNA